MPPLQNGVTERISGPANVSYKKRVLDRLEGDDEQGVIDFLELPEALQGEDLVADDTIRVRHNQSQGLLGTSLAEFDNGRTIAGYRRREMTRGDWLRIAGVAGPARLPGRPGDQDRPPKAPATGYDDRPNGQGPAGAHLVPVLRHGGRAPGLRHRAWGQPQAPLLGVA